MRVQSLFHKFVKKEDPPKEYFDRLGADRDYNIDLIPKFVMADGSLVKILVKTGVDRYLTWKKVDACYVYSATAGKGFFSSGKPGVEKVPATAEEAMGTPLVGMFQKMNLRSFLQFCAAVPDGSSVHSDGTDLKRITMKALYERFSLEEDTQDFVGHAMALHFDDSYKARPADETVQAIRLYARSLDRFGTSPFIYPVYGLSTLPESFARDCAVRGGIFMLNRDIDEILLDPKTGKVCGVRSGEGDAAEAAKCTIVIGDPSYFAKDKVRRTGRVVRAICICNERPPFMKPTEESAQVILPQKQLGRRNDVYIGVVSSSHEVAAPGKFIGIVATTVETDKPDTELAAGLNLLGAASGNLITRFINIVESVEPVDSGAGADGMFMTSSYDASSHFESTTEEVLRLYKNITGKEYNLSTDGGDETADGAAAGGGGGGK